MELDSGAVGAVTGGSEGRGRDDMLSRCELDGRR